MVEAAVSGLSASAHVRRSRGRLDRAGKRCMARRRSTRQSSREAGVVHGEPLVRLNHGCLPPREGNRRNEVGAGGHLHEASGRHVGRLRREPTRLLSPAWSVSLMCGGSLGDDVRRRIKRGGASATRGRVWWDNGCELHGGRVGGGLCMTQATASFSDHKHSRMR